MWGDSVYREFSQRAQNYKKVNNQVIGFMQPKQSDRSFTNTIYPQQYTEEMCESNAWQYLRPVKHDTPELAGNEDCGQVSARYILMPWDLYQICPGKPVISIGRQWSGPQKHW